MLVAHGQAGCVPVTEQLAACRGPGSPAHAGQGPLACSCPGRLWPRVDGSGSQRLSLRTELTSPREPRPQPNSGTWAPAPALNPLTSLTCLSVSPGLPIITWPQGSAGLYPILLTWRGSDVRPSEAQDRGCHPAPRWACVCGGGSGDREEAICVQVRLNSKRGPQTLDSPGPQAWRGDPLPSLSLMPSHIWGHRSRRAPMWPLPRSTLRPLSPGPRRRTGGGGVLSLRRCWSFP